MKKMLLSFLLIFTLLFALACDGEETETTGIQSMELLSDPSFQNGFTVNPADNDPQPDNRYPLAYDLTYGDSEGAIQWSIQQHGCRYGLADAYASGEKTIEQTGNAYIIEDPAKKVIVNPKEGLLTFEVNASEEYLDPRKDKEAWPHLIMEQGLTEQVMVSDVSEIILNMDVTLNKTVRVMDEDVYNPSLHAAQFLMYIVVRSNNAQDAGEFMWFGIPIYDSRYKFIPESGMADAGTSGNTGMFIYQTPSNEFLPNGIEVGNTYEINFDLLPQFERAIQLAHQKGFMLNSDAEDLYLTSMNIGWEIPGTFDVSMNIGDFSMIAYFD